MFTSIRARAKRADGIIVLPEANMDERVYKACKYILAHKLSKIIVFGKKTEYDSCFTEDINCKIIDIKRYKNLNNMAEMLYELRKSKGMTIVEAKRLVAEPNYFACMLVKIGEADGVVIGAKYSTKDAIKPGLQIIGLKPNNRKVSGLMIMSRDGDKPKIFSDVSLQINPDSSDLCDIALSGGEFMDKVLRKKPVIAMLSYSTLGSGEGESVDKVREATKLVMEKSNFDVVGEIQADSALDASTGKKKGVDSKLAGKFNVFVFPNIDAGNISYKMVTRLAKYTSAGPIMVNFHKPINDLSRGCTVEEIINTVCITKLQIEN